MIVELLFKTDELRFKNVDIAVKQCDVFLYALDRLFALIDFVVDDQQVLQPLLNVGLIGSKCHFLLAYLLFNRFTLTL